jgi:predicted dienelactone hydrolase
MKFKPSFFSCPLVFCLLILAPFRPVVCRAYDPLAVESNSAPTFIDLTAHDTARHRDIPIRVYLPTNTTPEPVVLFSHGLGGSREGSAFLGHHWASRGYVVIYVQHPGSDDSVWKNAEPEVRMDALRKAASVDNFLLRVKDIPAVLDQLALWNSDSGSPLARRLDLKHVGMSGHSFGAVTTQAVSGESFPLAGRKFTDSRIAAAIAFSPSSPEGGPARLATAFTKVSIPWMLMTGTKDTSPIGNQDAASRLAVYDHLSGIPKYELVLNNAEHSVFTDRALPGDEAPRNPNHHRVILALSTAFWDAYLRNDSAALAWLNSQQPRDIMETSDQWQFDAGPGKVSAE